MNIIYTIPIATLHNNYNSIEKNDNQTMIKEIFFNPIPLSENEFFSFFYSTNSKRFLINKSHYKNKHIYLSFQKKIDNDSSYFNLLDELLNAFSEKNDVNKNNIDHKILFGLKKEVKNIDSLALIYGSQTCINWNEVSDTLLSSGILKDRDTCYHDNASLLFQIKFIYYSQFTNICIKMIFQYQVNLLNLCCYLKYENKSFIDLKIKKNFENTETTKTEKNTQKIFDTKSNETSKKIPKKLDSNFVFEENYLPKKSEPSKRCDFSISNFKQLNNSTNFFYTENKMNFKETKQNEKKNT